MRSNMRMAPALLVRSRKRNSIIDRSAMTTVAGVVVVLGVLASLGSLGPRASRGSLGLLASRGSLGPLASPDADGPAPLRCPFTYGILDIRRETCGAPP
ncbi:hypothetical protein FMUAM8_50200 [Nocardia cyriacigeorgica]|nr:hypothetical protein FMUAM8_50200 [Nocardia cyriacigeorgica]